MFRSLLPLRIAFLPALIALAGCGGSVTTEKVSDKQDAVEQLAEDIQQLETSQEQRVAEAAQKERQQIQSSIEEKREQLQSEQRELAELMKRQAFEAEMEANVASLAKQVDDLESQANSAEGSEEVRFRQAAAALRTRHDSLHHNLEQLKSSQGESWDEQRSAVEAAWSEAEVALKQSQTAT
jgi:chromosome segregation ATPase